MAKRRSTSRRRQTDQSDNAQLALLWRTAELGQNVVGNTTLSRYIVFLTLLVLSERELQPSVVHLVAATPLTKAGVSRCMRELMEEGLLREVIDPDDRRLRRLHLTPKALRKADVLVREGRAIWSRVADLDVTKGPWRNHDQAGMPDMLRRLHTIAWIGR